MSDIHINRAGQNLGIFTAAEVQSGLDSGKYFGTDLGWRVGMESWKPLAQWADFTMPVNLPPTVAGGLAAGGLAAPHVSAVQSEGDLPSWEQKEHLGFFTAFGATIKEVLTEPAITFTRMKAVGGYMTPFIFLLIAALITTLLKWGVDAVVPPISMPSSFSQNAQLAPLLAMQKQGMASSGGMISTLIVLPIFLLLAAFITTAVWHVSLMILGGANKPFEATYRVYCYVAGACALLSMVPCCGPFISLGWNIVAGTIGLSKVHGIGSGKALTAILLPLILCCGLCSVGSYFLWNALSGNPEFMDAFNKALKDQ